MRKHAPSVTIFAEKYANAFNAIGKSPPDLEVVVKALRKLQTLGAPQSLGATTRSDGLPAMLDQSREVLKGTPENAVAIILAYNAFCAAMNAGMFDADCGEAPTL